MNIGIIAAEREEVNAVKQLIYNISEEKLSGLVFFKGLIANKNVVLVECGVGKVNSARACQCLIDYYKPDLILNIGVAGGIDSRLNIKDVVIADKLIQYDFDITKVGDYELGEICGLGKYFNCDERLIKLTNSLELDYKLITGIVGSADLFLSDSEKAKELNSKMGIVCVEMEGAAIAQVSQLNNIPFLVVRGISDVQNNNNKIDFNQYLKIVSVQVAKLILSLFKIL